VQLLLEEMFDEAREPLRWAEASADAQLHVNAFFDESRRATKARLTRSHA